MLINRLLRHCVDREDPQNRQLIQFFPRWASDFPDGPWSTLDDLGLTEESDVVQRYWTAVEEKANRAANSKHARRKRKQLAGADQLQNDEAAQTRAPVLPPSDSHAIQEAQGQHGSRTVRA